MTTTAIRFADRGVVDVIDHPVNDPADGELLIRCEYTVISPGTELAFLHGLPNTGQRWPTFFGYTGVGIVEKVGDGVEGFNVGDRVVGDLRHTHLHTRRAANCIPLPDNVSAKDAATWQLVAIALQGVRKARLEFGDTAAVFGLGPIGHLAAQICCAAGPSFVCGIDPVDWRRELCPVDATAPDLDAAKAAGPQRTRDGGFDVVVEATGVPAVINLAFQAAARFGRVVLLGSTRGKTEQVDFYTDVHKKGLTVLGAHITTRPNADRMPGRWTPQQDHLTSLELMAARRIDPSRIVSEWLEPAAAPDAYKRLHDREQGLMTIGFDWT